MYSLAQQRKTLYIVLALILTIHGGMLAVKLKNELSQVSFTPEKTIKLKLLQELVETSKNKKQIVQSEDSASKEKPTEAFLSDKDRKFERQTVARNVDSFNKAAKGNAKVSHDAKANSPAKKKGDHKNLKLSDFGVAAGDITPKVANRAPASVKGLENGDVTAQGLSSTNDYVEEMTLGDFTHLNTTEYKFYGFYHRIRQKLEQFWGRSIQEKANALFRSGRRIPANENLITSLQVTLNAKGEIVGVKILGTSGVREMDEAAIDSFNQAGPFPNPPSELLVNGKATIEWGFVVKS